MSSKDKENPLAKLRQFFRTSKGQGTAVKERDLGPELEKELRPETPAAQRCKTLKDLCEVVVTTRLEDAAIIKLLDLTKDLIVDNRSTEHRQTTLAFYCKLIKGQYKNLSLMREYFFRVIYEHNFPEDIEHRLELLITLTECGKTITNFEEKIGRFLLDWADQIVEAKLTSKYLDMLMNLIKFNAAHLDNDIIVGIIQQSCFLCCNVEDEEIGSKCLQVIDAVICYTIFPNETLVLCIVTLCRTVNAVPYCTMSWKVMKNLLGTNLGHSSLLTMCNILKDRNFYNDDYLLRGAVFHINMGLWSFMCPVASILKISTSTALVSFLHALDSQKMLVTYEVILSLRMMLPKYGKELQEHVWDVVCKILFAISENIAFHESIGLKRDFICQLKKNFHEVIDTIEQMLHTNNILLNQSKFYDLIERIAEDRPEISVLNLIEYRSKHVNPTCPQWLQVLHDFIERFYKISSTKIRCKIVQTLVQIMDDNRAAYEEEILERVVIPQFSNIGQENDIHVRATVSKALIEFARHCDTKRCGELLDIIEKIFTRPFDLYVQNSVITDTMSIFKTKNDIQDILITVEGLIEIFMVKLYRSSSCHAVQIYDMLIGHLEKHYQRPKIFEQFSIIREKIFSWILEARANGTFHLGFPDPANAGNIRFSHNLGVDTVVSTISMPGSGNVLTNHPAPQISSGGSDLNFTTISIRKTFKVVELHIELERDYSIFQLVLKKLTKILQNKALIQGTDIESLANILFKTFFDRKVIDLMQPFSSKPTSDDFNALVLPAIANLVIYHQRLPPSRQTYIIEALRIGIPSRIANICINTLTIMILEMPETLMRKLPDILLEMSKMSDTVAVAIPVLEFLSILSRLPNHLFTNFVSRQYMYVFAISLPYTKPHRYDHYTVSLAHHVIAGWFLKCKLNFRKNFVNYIVKSIQSNTRQPFEDDKISRNEFPPVNEDSSNRKRSSSLTERGSRVRDRSNNIQPQASNTDLRPLMNENLRNFHAELAETCIDFLTRHTFSPLSSLPKRLPTAEYLLKDGPSQTWLLGHNLITITTSGCSQPPIRNGLCERCLLLCKSTSSVSNSFAPNSPEVGLSQKDQPEFPVNSSQISTITTSIMNTAVAVNKRYTKASLQSSSGTDSGSTDLTSTTSNTSAQQHQQQPQQSTTSTQNSIESVGGRTVTTRQTSNEGRFSSSSSSLEALSRRGSNPDSTENREGSVGSLLGSTLNQQSAIPSPQLQIQQQICARSCTAWGEIYIRRPTGNIAWLIRIENSIINDCLGNDMPLHDLINLFLPVQMGGLFGPDFGFDNQLLSPSTVTQIDVPPEQRKINEESRRNQIIEQEAARAVAKVRSLKRQEEVISVSGSGPIDIPKRSKCHKEPAGSFSDIDPEDADDDVAFEDDDSKSRNPVRRVNSSPEMSSSWRNPFMSNKPGVGGGNGNAKTVDVSQNSSSENIVIQEKEDIIYAETEQQQKKKGFSKVSCEAIPEEIAGSTPPSQAESLKDGEDNQQMQNKTNETSERDNVLPPKQHSADDATAQSNTAANSISTTNLKLPIDKQKIISKPPTSPTPLSPRMVAKNAANKIASFAPNITGGSSAGIGNANTNNNNNDGNGYDSNGSDFTRGRSKTISVVREVNRNPRNTAASTFRPRGPPPVTNSRFGINPSFIFLQLFNTGQQTQASEVPLKVTPDNMKAVGLLDLIPPFETHKIGVLYVGPGQCNNETEILRNRFGSVRYVEFLRNLGTLVSLKDAKENNIFVNMETNGRDGNFTYVWKDDIVQVTFHVATLMPNHEKDPNCNEKKKHIGNDFVIIVYNESGEEYNLNTIKGQFNYACVVVQPLELNSNRIFVKAKKEIADYVCPPEPKIVSDSSAPLLARQLALHANLASLVSQSLKTKNINPYASNWLERLRKIKNLKAKLLKEIQTTNLEREQTPPDSSGSSSDVSKLQRLNIYDFTKYTG